MPAEKIEAWPRDGEKYIPVEARDFDNWVRSANDKASGRNARATINIAEYTARLENDGRLQGEGRWTIVLRGDKPAFLPLSNMSLMLRDPHWQDSPQQPVRLGTWGQNGHEPERFGLEVGGSGVLTFGWHIQTHSTDDQIEIPWLAPTANSVRLVLDLPEGKQPRIDGGVVLESTRQQADDKTHGKPLRRWVIALTASHNTNLRILNTDRATPQPAAKTAMREDVSYQVGPRGLDMTAAWQLAGPADQKRELAVAVPPGLQLSSLKAGGRDLMWRLVRDASSPTDTALIELPTGDPSKPLQITFNAWQPLVFDAPWRLPRLRPEGVFWSAGKFELSVAAAYELERLEPTDCVQTGVSPTNASADAPEVHSLTAYTPSAALEITLSRRQPDATIRAGSSLALADPDLNGRLVTQWNLSRGATHQLVGKLAADWVVEAVETIPADAMAEWFIDRHGEERQIEIQLSRAASAGRNVSVIITARLQRFSLAQPISAETMRMVTWVNARAAQHLLTFESSEPYAVERVGKLPEVSPDSIDDNDRALLDQAADNKIFDITDAGKNDGLQLTLRRGHYAAQIDLEMTYENEVLRQEYRLAAQPAAGPIDRLIVHSTAPLGDGVRWTDIASNAPLKAEKLFTDDAQRKGLPKEGESWLLRLPQPTSRPIEISASVSTKRPERALVPLLSFPEATEQRGRILVRCRYHDTLWLEPVRLQTIPLPPDAPGPGELNSPPHVCAAYRYQPTDCRDAARSPKLWVGATSDSTSSPPTARHIQLESFYWPDGGGTHCAIYQLENHGASEMKVSLPAEARLVTASLDGHPLDVAGPEGSPQPAVIHLPSQTRSTTLSLYFETRGPPLTAGRELTPPLVLNELPFLTGDWTIWLPEEYSASGTALSNAAPKFNWRQRIFGLLGRPNGARPFNPLRLADGAALINGLADGNVVGPQDETSTEQPQVTGLDQNNEALVTPVASTVTSAAGWRSYHESFIANGPAPIVVMHPSATTAWTVVLLLASFLCGRWLRRSQDESFATALAVAAGVALLLPTAYADMAAGAVLGLLLSLLADWPRRAISTDDSVQPRRTKTAIAGALAVAIAVGLTRLSLAQSPQPESLARNASSPNIYRVLIPTDAEGRPSGTKYYLSEKFLRALMAAGSDSPLDDGQWILSDAAFSGELREQPGRADIVAGNWTMTFSIETLARDTTVVLPLIRNEAEWNATAMLDGVPLPLQWRDGDRTCAIEIAEPGRYSLAVSCLPKTTLAEGRNQIEFAIPPVLGAKVEVRFPASTSGLTVSHASVLPPPASATNILNGELDRIGRLHVQWSRSEKQENGKQGLSLTELRWLDIKPAETELAIKYVLEGGARRPDSFTVAYDSRWKLLTDEKPATNEPAKANPAGQHLIRVPISTQSTDRQAVLLRWRLRDPLALGNFRLPPVELSSVPVSKRWLAVSADPSLECEIRDSSATDGTVNEFFAKWGAPVTNDTPQMVLSNFDASRAWSLAIRPHETEPAVDEALNVAAGRNAVRVLYEAKATPGNFGAYRFDLSVPAQLTINEISVTEADRPIPLRWSRSANNRVSVFFDQQIAKPYRLVLAGSTRLDANGKTNLPHVSALATEAATQKVRLYRNDDVHVDLEGLVASAESKAEPIDPPPPQWNVRPVAVCNWDNNSAAAVRVVVKPSANKIGGETLTALTRENGAWWANYRCQLAVEDGDLDVLRLRVPSIWTGPFDVQSALPVSTELKPVDDQIAILSIRFATTVAKGSGVDLRIRSPLKPSTGTAVSVPAIVPESLAHGRRYLSVPDSADSQPMLWTDIGVRQASIPQKLLAGFAAPSPALSFEIISNPFQVAIRSQAVPEAAPQIRLADTAVVAGEFGTQLIATRLVLAPHGLSECTLQLPAGQTLVAVTLDGRPALIRPLDKSHWQLALGPPQLPQSLEIVSRSTDENIDGGPAELQRPALLADGKPIPAEVSLWSFAHPLKSVRRLMDGADQVSAVEQAALRFDRLVSIAEVAKTTAAELPTPDGYNWFQPWAKLLTTVRSQTRQTAVPHFAASESQVSHTSEEQISQAGERLDKWLENGRKSLAGPNPEKVPGPPTSTDMSMSSLLTTPGTGQWTYYVAEGGNDRLDLQLRPVVPTTSQIRLIGLVLIVGLLIVTIWLMRWPAASDFLCRWPHALGILLGIAYWAWMWPSWLGILIVAGSLWLALRYDWPGRSLRTEASTVLRGSQTT